MTAQMPKTFMKRVESLPPVLQRELAAIVCEMDATQRTGTYRATPAELRGIDRGLRDAHAKKFATKNQVSKLFQKHRPT